jgi:hypothetical protein
VGTTREMLYVPIKIDGGSTRYAPRIGDQRCIEVHPNLSVTPATRAPTVTMAADSPSQVWPPRGRDDVSGSGRKACHSP